MSCELFDCCRFLNDNMKTMPKAAEYVRNKLCFGDHESCIIFKRYLACKASSSTIYLYPDDADEVQKIIRCLQRKA